MNLRLPSAALALFASVIATPAFSQTAVSNNTVVELPSIAPVDGQADTSSVAVNDDGDIMVVWTSAVYPPGHALQNKFRVEGAFLRRKNRFTWVLYPTITLGESKTALLPGGTPVYPGGDKCNQPDVVAVGNNFVAAWQRVEEGGTENGQIECAYIEVPAAGNATISLADPAGIGYVLDSAFDPRNSGGLVDLAFDRGSGNNRVVASYVSRRGRILLNVGKAFDFNVLGIAFEFAGSGMAPTASAIQTMASNIAFDDFDASGPKGGRIWPSLVFDSFGNLVLALEEFHRGDRVSSTTPDTANINLRRFTLDAAGDMTQINLQLLVGSNTAYAQRRPNLLRTSTQSDISLSWQEIQLPGDDSDIFHFNINYLDAVSNAVLTDFAPVMIPGVDEALPNPVQFNNVRTVIAVADPPGPSGLVMGHQLTTKARWLQLTEFAGLAPWNPAVDVLDVDPLRPGRGLLLLSVSGRMSLATRRILLEIMIL
jgi:hypothetical protein